MPWDMNTPFLKRAVEGISNMEKLLTKAKFNELIGDLVVKPEGAPVLVPETDKRKVWQPKQTAEEAFKDIDLNKESGGN